MKKRELEKHSNKWSLEFIDAAKAAVIGYEKYLKDELNHIELAKIMKLLRSYIPVGMTGGEENDAI